MAKANGLKHLPEIIATHPDYDEDLRSAYLGGHIRYALGDREKAGLNKFIELLKLHGHSEIYEPTMVG